jgi:hypothetical protein
MKVKSVVEHDGEKYSRRTKRIENQQERKFMYNITLWRIRRFACIFAWIIRHVKCMQIGRFLRHLSCVKSCTAHLDLPYFS